MKSSLSQVAENIKLYCHINDINQSEIADELGISKMAVSKWFKGQAIPKMSHIDRLSIITGIPVAALFIEKSALNWKRSIRSLLRDAG